MLFRCRRAMKQTGGVVACIAAAGIFSAAAPASIPPKSAAALGSGTYSGTVKMGVKVGGTSPYYAATLTGTWTLKVDKAGHLRGSESMQATIPFTSPDSNGCTYSPTSWTLGFKGTLGTKPGEQGTPGSVQRGSAVVYLDSGWTTAPSSYNRTCGPDTASWPMAVIVEYGATEVGIGTTLHLPIGLFQNRARSYTLRLTNVMNYAFTQTYTLVSRPKK